MPKLFQICRILVYAGFNKQESYDTILLTLLTLISGINVLNTDRNEINFYFLHHDIRHHYPTIY